jgi:hypothetical protein
MGKARTMTLTFRLLTPSTVDPTEIELHRIPERAAAAARTESPVFWQGLKDAPLGVDSASRVLVAPAGTRAILKSKMAARRAARARCPRGFRVRRSGKCIVGVLRLMLPAGIACRMARQAANSFSFSHEPYWVLPKGHLGHAGAACCRCRSTEDGHDSHRTARWIFHAWCDSALTRQPQDCTLDFPCVV